MVLAAPLVLWAEGGSDAPDAVDVDVAGAVAAGPGGDDAGAADPKRAAGGGCGQHFEGQWWTWASRRLGVCHVGAGVGDSDSRRVLPLDSLLVHG